MNALKRLTLISAIAMLPAFAFAQTGTSTPTASTPAPAAAPAATPAKVAKHHHGARLKAADKDGDGMLSKSEVDNAKLTRLSKNFDAIDTNHDGKLSRAEIKAYRKAHKGTHKKGGSTTPAPTPVAPAAPSAPAK